MEIQKYKPVTFINGRVGKHKNNVVQQMMLLRAMAVTDDPKKLRQMIGVKTVAEVYRTLDKLAMRREYHQALARSGLSFDYIVEGIKKIADSGFKDSDKLSALKTLLKSLGMDRYDVVDEGSAKNWEEALLEAVNNEETSEEIGDYDPGIIEYPVEEPEVPEDVQVLHDKDKKLNEQLYGEGKG